MTKEETAAYNKAYRAKNSEKLKITKKKWADKNREKLNARARELRNENKEEVNKKRKIYRENNKDRLNKYFRNYYKNNSEKINARQYKRLKELNAKLLEKSTNHCQNFSITDINIITEKDKFDDYKLTAIDAAIMTNRTIYSITSARRYYLET